MVRPFGSVRFHSRIRGALAALLAATLLAGCSELMVDPAARPAVLQIALISPAASSSSVILADAGAAFDRAERIGIRVSGANGSLLDTTRELDESEGEIRLQVEVDVEDAAGPFHVELELLWEGRRLFEAERDVSLEPGSTTDAEFTLVPVPDRIEPSPEALGLTALGEQAQLSADVVFATGDPIPGAAPSWASSSAEIIGVDTDGTVTARAVGQAAALASWQGLSAQVPVEVRQEVAVVGVMPETALVAEGGVTQLEAALFDANQNPIPDGTVTVSWSSDDPGIATVDDTGLVEGVSDGSTTIRATAEEASGTAAVTVESTAGAVAGVVIDGLTGAPIAGASVDFGSGRTILTDSAGAFELNLPEGSWEAVISASGYVSIQVDGVTVSQDETTELGTLRLYSDEYGPYFGVWEYRGVVEFPEAGTPDWLVFQPPDLFWDVDDGGSCYVIDDPDVVVLSIDGDIWTFENRDAPENERIFTYRITFDTEDVMRMELQDEDFDLTFIFDRTSLTVDDFQPACSAAATDAESRFGALQPPGRPPR